MEQSGINLTGMAALRFLLGIFITGAITSIALITCFLFFASVLTATISIG